MISLERRFVVGLAVVLLAVFGLLFWGAVTAVKSLGEAYVVARLEHDAESLLAALAVTPQGQIRLRDGRITPIYRQPLSGHYFQFDAADGGRDLMARADAQLYRAKHGGRGRQASERTGPAASTAPD